MKTTLIHQIKIICLADSIMSGFIEVKTITVASYVKETIYNKSLSYHTILTNTVIIVPSY